MSKDCHTADRLLCPALYTCHQASRQKDYDSLRDMSIRFLIKHIRPVLALTSWLDARLIPDGTTCITIIGHRGKAHPIAVLFRPLRTNSFGVRRMSPAGTVTYRFPDNTKSLCSKNFSNPLSSITRRCGTDKISPHQFMIAHSGADPLISGMCPKEDVGFEPTRRITT